MHIHIINIYFLCFVSEQSEEQKKNIQKFLRHLTIAKQNENRKKCGSFNW